MFNNYMIRFIRFPFENITSFNPDKPKFNSVKLINDHYINSYNSGNMYESQSIWKVQDFVKKYPIIFNFCVNPNETSESKNDKIVNTFQSLFGPDPVFYFQDTFKTIEDMEPHTPVNDISFITNCILPKSVSNACYMIVNFLKTVDISKGRLIKNPETIDFSIYKYCFNQEYYSDSLEMILYITILNLAMSTAEYSLCYFPDAESKEVNVINYRILGDLWDLPDEYSAIENIFYIFNISMYTCKVN